MSVRNACVSSIFNTRRQSEATQQASDELFQQISMQTSFHVRWRIKNFRDLLCMDRARRNLLLNRKPMLQFCTLVPQRASNRPPRPGRGIAQTDLNAYANMLRWVVKAELSKAICGVEHLHLSLSMAKTPVCQSLDVAQSVAVQPGVELQEEGLTVACEFHIDGIGLSSLRHWSSGGLRGTYFTGVSEPIPEIACDVPHALLLNEYEGLLEGVDLVLTCSLSFLDEPNQLQMETDGGQELLPLPQNTLGKDLATLLTDKTSDFDAIIVADGHRFHVHRCILAARSAIFREMFMDRRRSQDAISIRDFDLCRMEEFLDGVTEGNRAELDVADLLENLLPICRLVVRHLRQEPTDIVREYRMDDADAETIMNLLQHIYSGTCLEAHSVHLASKLLPFAAAHRLERLATECVNIVRLHINEQNVEKYAAKARECNIPVLTEACATCLAKVLKPENVIKYLLQAHKHRVARLKEAAFRLLVENSRELRKSSQWSELCESGELLAELFCKLAEQSKT